jgi:hypothetical protein
MRKTFAPLDDVLIEQLFQPISDLMTHRLGASRAMAACFCIDVASLAWIVSRARGLSESVATWNASAAFMDVSFLLLGLIALMALRALFRRAAGKPANPLRLVMRPHRAIVLLMLVAQLMLHQAPDLADVANIAMLVFATSALYLGACAERPPIRRVSAGLVPAT